MKNANGLGSIYKLSGKRRKPWALSFSVWDKNHVTRKRKIIGYYKTKNEAEIKRLDILSSNYGIDTILINKDTTFKDCALESLKRAENNLADSTIISYQGCLKVLVPLHDVKMQNFTALMYQSFIDDLIAKGIKAKRLSNINALTHRAIKVALRKGIISNNPIDGIDISGASRNKDRVRKPFTHDEIKALWNKKDDMAKILLILIYTGLRIDEFINIKSSDYSKQSLTIRKSKTISGIRNIPVADCIKPFIEDNLKKYDTLSPYYNTNVIRKAFNKYKIKNDLNHILHETRYTFATLLDEARLTDGNRIDIMVIKVLMGHKVSDITKGIYTHENYARLIEAVNALPFGG